MKESERSGNRRGMLRASAALGRVWKRGHARSLPSALPLPIPRPGSARWDGERGGLGAGARR